MKVKIGNKAFEVPKDAEGGYPEEVVLEFDGVLRTQEEESTFIENHKKDARKEGLEIAVKQHREKYGFTGRSLDKLIEAVEKKTLEDAEIEPAEQAKKLQGLLDEKEIALNNALANVSDKENEFNSYKNQAKIDRTLESLIPEKTILPREDMKLILKTKLNFDTDEDGNIVVLDNLGNILKDTTTANPITANDVVENFFKDNQNYLKPIEGGAGGGDSSGSSNKQSIDEFIEEQQGKGVKVNSVEFNDALKSKIEAGLVEA